MRKLGSGGYTLVEVTISLVVTGLLIFSILNFTTNILVQYAESEVRSEFLSGAHTALDIVNNDIRLSASADDTNRWPDGNSPSGSYGWQSDGDTLVLATAAEDGSGDIIFADSSEYISRKNNIVYFISGGSLYKRVIAAPDTNNSATTTCPESASSPSCPPDKELLENVDTFGVKYIDGEGNEVTPANARSIELAVKLYTEEFSRPISVKYDTRMVFRND